MRQLTSKSVLGQLRKMFPDALRIYVSDDADYFDGVLTTEVFILITHETFRAPTLGEAMAQVRLGKRRRMQPEKGKGNGWPQGLK